MQFVPAICVYCKHFDRNKDTESLTCKAFPGGIPVAILHSEHDHRQPFLNDSGIVFELRNGKQIEFDNLLSLLEFSR